MYTNNRDAYRQAFCIAWQKYQKNDLLEPVESQLIEIILLHPEYHALLEKPDQLQSQEFAIEENPFFHMSLHMAVKEQIKMNKPAGVTPLFQVLVERFEDKHEVEHLMMQCLANLIWESQRSGIIMDEGVYLEKLKGLLLRC